MSKHYPTMASNILTSFLLASVMVFTSYSLADTNALTPYKAQYQAKYKGMSAKAERSLQPTKDQHWQLQHKASVLFTGFDETSLFTLENHQVKPLHYQYHNQLSSKRNKTLIFNWDKAVVDTKKGGNATQLPLPENALDQLSMQLQLRQDLLCEEELFSQHSYTVVDTGKIKQYNIKKLGEEWLETPVGKLLTVKLEQTRQGKNRRTIIWMAKDWQYLLVRLQRFKDGSPEYLITLKSAQFDGKAVTGL